MRDHITGLTVEENKAFVEAIAWYVVCIVNLGAEQSVAQRTISDSIGTGTACTFQGHTIILTAEHVVADAQSEDLRFLLRVGQAIDWDSKGTPGLATTIPLPIKQIVRCQHNDLAAIEIEQGGLEGLNIRTCQLPMKLARDRKINDHGGLVLIGYPIDQALHVDESKSENVLTNLMACVPTPLMGELVHDPKAVLDSSYDPDRDVLMRFDPAEFGQKPHGYSGAALWCDPVKPVGPVWNADPVFFGLITHAYMRPRLLKAVGAPVIRRFLQEHFS